VFQPLLEVPVADRRRLLGLPPDRRQQRPADPMALEVEGEGDPRPRAGSVA
jgi:hypothetical protein